MSTNALIGYQADDGSIYHVYCHYDGYYTGVGKMLQTHYKDLEQVKALISLGDMSSLEENIEKTVYYGRDRGEEGISPQIDHSLGRFQARSKSAYYKYLFTNGQWYCASGSYGELMPMSATIGHETMLYTPADDRTV